MRKLNLDILKNGLHGVTQAFGTFLVEAAMYCLEENGHQGKAYLKITGDFEDYVLLEWSDTLTEEVKSSWVDKNEATEYGATAIAMLIILSFTQFDIFRRTRGGTDYVLAKSESSTLNKKPDICYLEISGIWKENKTNSLNMRLNLKKKQVGKTVINAPAFIVVTEFGNPKTKISKQ